VTGKMRLLAAAAALACAWALPAAGRADTVTVNTYATQPGSPWSKAWDYLKAEFEKENPGTELTINQFDSGSFDTLARAFLVNESPDVFRHYGGGRLFDLVKAGLIEPSTKVWDEGGLRQDMAGLVPSMSYDGQLYCVPILVDSYGFFYRKDIFAQYGLAEPKTYDDLLKAAATLKQNGIIPFTIGTQQPWTTAAWFDYFILRTAGIDFYFKLMAGEIPYTDPKVRHAMDLWGDLVKKDYFTPDHSAYTEETAAVFMVQGQSAMFLMGSFLLNNIPDADKDKIGWFPFPTIDAAMPTYEHGPADTMCVPARAKNKSGGDKFLAFFGRADVQTTFTGIINSFPANTKSTIRSSEVFQKMLGTLKEAKGLVQYYDIDTSREMAEIGMDAFQQFMFQPDNADAILADLDQQRQRIFKK